MSSLIGAKIAAPYADAFFQQTVNIYLADSSEASVFYKFVFEVQDLLLIIEKTPQLQDFLASPMYTDEAKKVVMGTCCKNFSTETKNFINLLVDKKRIGYLEAIGGQYLKQTYEFLCIKFADVSSVVELEPNQISALKDQLVRILGPAFIDPLTQYYTVQTTTLIDESILGGFTVKIGSQIIDLSLKNDLNQISKKLGGSIKL